ncbi:hypothetical protein GYH30_043967 [Glycine max]|uniref:Uncharacterized protein n=1 Tax=Glycine soja TaxID=3848 RepID=A0A445GDT9_GLYSO|nr:uncharacterized protein LOC114389280 [Glycine soja]KAH1149697.1 hypothetical protein GYH30_043967 [Glycine max]RZB59328.1 hypothetical protein D0Y65_042536 [Glycine soja]
MGLHRWWQVKLVTLSLFLSCLVGGSQSYFYDRESLDDFLRKQANKETERLRKGVLSNVSLPSNFTGMEVSVVRLRSFSLWSRGMNYSSFNLPPRIVLQPNAKRIAILFENLGNWSSNYYNVPNHTMVASVFGVMAYSSSETAFVDEKINFTTHGDPIRIRFPHVDQHGENDTPICAKFRAGGLVKFKNMTKPYVCEVYSQGHYTLVVPSFPSPKEPNTRSHSKRFTKWWVLGFVIGFTGLVILVLILLALVKEAKKRRIRKMEKNSEGGELFDTFWIGESKLPSASMLRTQPTLEN